MGAGAMTMAGELMHLSEWGDRKGKRRLEPFPGAC